MKNQIYLIAILVLICSCTVSKKYEPGRKFSPGQLREDYSLFRKIIEESHPSLYWYTTKDSLDYYLDEGYARLKDSMPEYKFRMTLSYVLSKIHCGHTTVRASPAASHYAETTNTISFPVNVKIWPDTAVITSDINRRDSFIIRGQIIRSVEGRPIGSIVDTMFRYLSADGYTMTHKYQTLSNPGMFRGLYGYIYGLRRKMPVEIVDTDGQIRHDTLAVYNPLADTVSLRPVHQLTRKERRLLLRMYNRNMHIDTATNTAFMELNTFTKGYDLRSFFKRSFKKMRKQHVQHLVLDIRSNGGGSVVLSNLLTRYLAEKPFKIADSLYAVKRKSSYGKYQENYTLNRLFLLFLTHKRDDGHYHFTYYENKYFRPKERNHFDGQVYILTGGNTFSAAVLFAKALKGQKNVTIVGEETGGGAYGNTAWLIPDVMLPRTKVRFRLPLFRLVIDKNAQKGRGVFPDIEVGPSVEAIKMNKDPKMEKVKSILLGKGEH